MKVSLVDPKIPPAPMNFQFAMDLGAWSFSHIPLGLATVASLVPSGVDVDIQDENAGAIDLDTRADLVALTAIGCQKDRLFELARTFKKRGKRVAIGGPLAHDLTVEELREARVDHLFVGEAEETWPRFFDDLKRGTAREVYRAEDWADMDRARVPRFDLVDARRYSGGSIQATRGCPYRCEYCDVPVRWGNRSRTKPVEIVLEEIRQLSKLGYESIFMVDDHFAGNRAYARRLLEEIAALQPRLRRPIYFVTQVTLNVAKDPELLDLFRRANFKRFFLGIETSNVDQLKSLQKHHNLELEMQEAVSRIHERGITVWAGLMLGLDGDDASSFERQRRFVEESKITPTLVGLLQAMPGTPLEERVRAEGRILPGGAGSGVLAAPELQGTTNLVPRDMDVPTLFQGFATLVRRIYDPRAFGERLIASVAKARHDPYPEPFLSVLRPKSLALLARTARWYLGNEDAGVRRLFFRILEVILTRKVKDFRELVYHLVIYKHLWLYYNEAARRAEIAAREPAVATR